MRIPSPVEVGQAALTSVAFSNSSNSCAFAPNPPEAKIVFLASTLLPSANSTPRTEFSFVKSDLTAEFKRSSIFPSAIAVSKSLRKTFRMLFPASGP